MATKEPAHAILPVDITHRHHCAEPGAGVFCELWIRGLEKNFDAVEGTDHSFGLKEKKRSLISYLLQSLKGSLVIRFE